MVDTITLDRDLRLMLLRWLKSGIDTKELSALYDQYCSISNMTDEELDAELERLYRADFDFRTCDCLRRVKRGRCTRDLPMDEKYRVCLNDTSI